MKLALYIFLWITAIISIIIHDNTCIYNHHKIKISTLLYSLLSISTIVIWHFIFFYQKLF